MVDNFSVDYSVYYLRFLSTYVYYIIHGLITVNNYHPVGVIICEIWSFTLQSSKSMK